MVEAEYRSGTTITAKFAKKQGKDLFCIPSSIENSKGAGTNLLIQKGAKLVVKPKDIIEIYTKNIIEQISIEELETTKKEQLKDLSKIKEEYREVYKMISEGMSLNAISIKTKLNLQELYHKLFMMEMEGLIENNKNKYNVI